MAPSLPPSLPPHERGRSLLHYRSTESGTTDLLQKRSRSRPSPRPPRSRRRQVEVRHRNSRYSPKDGAIDLEGIQGISDTNCGPSKRPEAALLLERRRGDVLLHSRARPSFKISSLSISLEHPDCTIMDMDADDDAIWKSRRGKRERERERG